MAISKNNNNSNANIVLNLIERSEENHHQSDNNKNNINNKQNVKGVSVHYLNTVFIDEVKKYDNKGTNKTINEIEDMSKDTNGLIRQKGEDVRCPRDGKLGAAYVDCLEGDDNVGIANLMLSYSWGNTVQDIVEVLVSYCTKNKLDPKRTYVWICSLCNNQHRVAADRKKGKNVPFDQFEEIFGQQVQNIGNVVALLAPWDKPLYLQRIWCVFEAFTASECDGCNLSIEMPAREKEAFKKHILSDHRAYNKIFNALAGTMIQNAEASVEEDRKNILRLVQEGCGADKLNARVNKLLREWLNQNLVEFVHDIDSLLKVEHYGGKKPIELIVAYNHLGHVFYHNLQFELAMDCYQKQLDLSKVNFGSKDVVTSSAYNNIALVYSHWNQCDEAIELFQKNIDILLETYGNDHYNQWTASMYCNIGSAYKEKGDMDMALYYYEKCRLKSEGMYGLEHERTSSVYNEIGFVHAEKGNLDKALVYLHKSLKIIEEVLGLLEHPSTAASYNNIASIYFEKGKYDDALRYFLKALHILEKVHGHHHPNTVTLYENIFLIYFEKGNIKKQAEFWEKAQLKTIIIL